MINRLLDSDINRVILAGNVDTAPFGAVALTGLASWSTASPESLRITGYSVSELETIRPFDAILVNGEMAIVREMPSLTEATSIVIKLIPSKTFTTTFAGVAIAHSKGVMQSNYPSDWHIGGTEYSVNGVDYTQPQNFHGQDSGQGIVLINATADVTIGTGLISGGGSGGGGGGGVTPATEWTPLRLNDGSANEGTIYVNGDGTEYRNFKWQVIAAPDPNDIIDINYGTPS